MDILQAMIKAAKEAGDILLMKKKKLKNIQTKKSSSDLVSEADLESQKLIINTIMNEFPDAIILAEENWNGDKRILKHGKKVFVIDPLDGTLNYVHGMDFYSISIAMLDDGDIKYGVVYLPETDKLYFSEKGNGSYLNGLKLYRKDNKKLSESMFVTGWPYEPELFKKSYEAIEKIQKNIHEVRILGSAAAELCMLAEGKIDGYWEYGLSPWDLAAGVLIAKEAGMEIYSISHKEFDISKGEILATFKHNINKVYEILKE
ncbi:myo-inositol-1(or 4)-monophosphatase [Marinitoga hydrogenitolerans DSM 16785]|uniref:Inositol-1-monophosphatase n=1 Tax=Marinitoga hydrogenitolerans (strain DSM 16785 / JCM 12826 / AT1271) TaxID=1122195 RepID=A0A1M4YMB8_MARH1|nr:inositol monophosphatase family protein [Marinitoga hydrogenitolerans]SHF06891.1 myo-inositol-1(or 4)-monophosphatase [Marinitoga hydrogenitolerans DSM 16785]